MPGVDKKKTRGKVGLSGRYYSDSTRSPSSTQMGTTKSVVFGRVDL